MSDPTSKTVARWTWTRVELEDLRHLGYISRHKTGEFVNFADYDSREGELLAEIERLRGALDRIGNPRFVYSSDDDSDEDTQLSMRMADARASLKGCSAHETTPCHSDPSGKTREPPHCPSCSCGMQSMESRETREQRTRQPLVDSKLTVEVALREANRCRQYPDRVLNEQVIVVLADQVLKPRAEEPSETPPKHKGWCASVNPDPCNCGIATRPASDWCLHYDLPIVNQPGCPDCASEKRAGSPVEPTAYLCPNCANAGCTDCQPATRNLGPEAPGGVGVTDLAARSLDQLCNRCRHSYGQHTKGPVAADYCRHCACPKFVPYSPEKAPCRHDAVGYPSGKCLACGKQIESNSPENGTRDV